VADETVNKPYLDPWIEKKMSAKTDNTTDEETTPPVANKQKTLPGSQNK
jgi:hypothetical protein